MRYILYFLFVSVGSLSNIIIDKFLKYKHFMLCVENACYFVMVRFSLKKVKKVRGTLVYRKKISFNGLIGGA